METQRLKPAYAGSNHEASDDQGELLHAHLNPNTTEAEMEGTEEQE